MAARWAAPYKKCEEKRTVNAKEELDRIFKEHPEIIDYAIAALEQMLQIPPALREKAG